MMQSKQKMIIETPLRDLISLAYRIGEADCQAKSFRVNCREMGKRVYQLLQMLKTLLCLITLDPILLFLNPIHRVISEVSRILQETLNLACKCKRKTIFCRLFSTGTQTTSNFHKLFHLLDDCIAKMNWLLIIYNLDFNNAFNEIFLSLPQILSNDSSIPSAWSFMVTENMIWEIAPILTSDNVGIVEGLMLCLAKLVGAERGESQCNCLIAIIKITAAAESDLDLRCKAFKTNSPGAKTIVEQLLRVIKESEGPKLQVLAISNRSVPWQEYFMKEKITM